MNPSKPTALAGSVVGVWETLPPLTVDCAICLPEFAPCESIAPVAFTALTAAHAAAFDGVVAEKFAGAAQSVAVPLQ
ncbi:unannotated protein [freshwater metagenome]|uniref:Unannotated protein n=1 Tax=freshwater metagenome TaxID=449393 RepID=A0A6J6G511_9ZZZZ